MGPETRSIMRKLWFSAYALAMAAALLAAVGSTIAGVVFTAKMHAPMAHDEPASIAPLGSFDDAMAKAQVRVAAARAADAERSRTASLVILGLAVALGLGSAGIYRWGLWLVRTPEHHQGGATLW